MSDAFQTAVLDSKKLTSKPSNDDLLELYALYKIANGEKIDDSEQPGMFDLKGKAKRKAWQAKVDEGLTVDEAKTKYVEKVEALKQSLGYDANKAPEEVGTGN
ncbi:acyl binding protein [Rutstroemia sp. NJR-2017a WRK4]|nr:acyl binding protein [Rutstroemia sp. NJR-2017a WRK4]